MKLGEPPSFGLPMRIHHDAAEAFHVTADEVIIFVPDEECPAWLVTGSSMGCHTH